MVIKPDVSCSIIVNSLCSLTICLLVFVLLVNAIAPYGYWLLVRYCMRQPVICWFN